MITLRPFQVRTCRSAARALASNRSVLVVSPTGSGKTVIGTAIVKHFWLRSLRTLFVAHRRELIMQSAEKLRVIGQQEIGVIMPGHECKVHCAIQVGTIQTLLAKGFPDNIDLVVLDEAHHYNADDWSEVFARYPKAKFLGLTATPMRQDGRPLGDMLETMIVAESYSNLLEAGYIVPCRVYQPEQGMKSNEVAQDPLVAYQTLGNGARAFGYASRVEQCNTLAHRFTSAGIHSRVIEAGTKRDARDESLRLFRKGEVRVLWNVYALTEGVDVPEAGCVIIARQMSHAGMYLQTCGRVLRPAEGKSEAVIIDLSGATLLHGFPTEDREYSLDGTAIKRTSAEPLRVCPRCGATSQAWRSSCPECGFVPPVAEAPKLKIYSQALREVFAGIGTPQSAKQAELQRLIRVATEKGWDMYAVRKNYLTLFGEIPDLRNVDNETKRVQLDRLRSRYSNPKQANVMYKELFGSWP
jgi:DNA repair protein RadD